MSTHRLALVWFRRDLRLTDNPAVQHACAEAAQIVPVYIHAPHEEAPWAPGAASRWWLHHSLAALDQSLRTRGSRLVLREGASDQALVDLIRRTKATLVCCNRIYEPTALRRDEAVEKVLERIGVELVFRDGGVLVPPSQLKNAAGNPYRVFTPFWRALQKQISLLPAPAKAPRHLPEPARWPSSAALHSFNLLPRLDWDAGMRAAWQPGEAHALKRLHAFDRDALETYPSGRDRPGEAGTSRLSPPLHFGEIGPKQLHFAIAGTGGATTDAARAKFLSELGWREFAQHLLYHFPHTTDQPLDPRFARIRWSQNSRALKAWQQGLTGIPIVDAGMRELWQTGWMHNRVRMIVASFLTKNLTIDWCTGARWFWDTLVDADLANNTLGWQWVAGCSADAAPYFRVFNSVLQSQRFDRDGTYIRRYVPELRQVPAKWIHEPWHAPAAVLQAASVTLGRDYPRPIVDLKQSRERALKAYRSALIPPDA
jgi:deoxyribodipyrimidine photo-lyase